MSRTKFDFGTASDSGSQPRTRGREGRSGLRFGGADAGRIARGFDGMTRASLLTIPNASNESIDDAESFGFGGMIRVSVLTTPNESIDDGMGFGGMTCVSLLTTPKASNESIDDNDDDGLGFGGAGSIPGSACAEINGVPGELIN